MTDRPIKVLIVDDSLLFRMTMRDALTRIDGVEVVDSASNGREALEKIDALDPDLLTLDVQMPDVDGIEVLRQIRRRGLRTKAVMVSSLTAAGAEATAASLLEGAFDFLLKPTGTDPKENLLNLRSALEEKIDAFRQSRRPGKRSAESPRPSSGRLWSRKTKPQIVVIGCSTGGPEALREILPELPPELPVPVLVAQHMPAQFTGPLAARLNAISRIRVIEADNGMEVAPGTVMIAPGGRQTAIHRRNNQFVIATSDDPPEHGCRPSVDYLLRSVVENYGETALAIILTGMGRDGTEGCRLLKERGGSVWAQDEATSIVFGMPRSVQSAGLADAVVSLGDVAREVIRNCR